MRYTKKVLKKEDGVRPSGGIGRRTGLKILRDLTLVPVQVRPRAPFLNYPLYLQGFCLSAFQFAGCCAGFFVK